MMLPKHLIHEHVVHTLVLDQLTGFKARPVVAGFHIRMVWTDHRALVFAENDQLFFYATRCAGERQEDQPATSLRKPAPRMT